MDAGAYARLLMLHAKEEAELAAEEGETMDPQTILERAFYRTDVQARRRRPVAPCPAARRLRRAARVCDPRAAQVTLLVPLSGPP